MMCCRDSYYLKVGSFKSERTKKPKGCMTCRMHGEQADLVSTVQLGKHRYRETLAPDLMQLTSAVLLQ